MTIRDPQIEFVLAQHPWLENDCIYADIVLPVSTHLEVDDVMPCVRDGEHFQTMLNMRKAIEPIGEAKSDFEAVVEIAKKLGMVEEVTGGYTVPEYIEGVYKGMNFDKIVSWEEFQEKDYMVLPVSRIGETCPAGLYEFYKDPVAHRCPRRPESSNSLREPGEGPFPNDEERPAYPHGSRRASHTTIVCPAQGRGLIHCLLSPTTQVESARAADVYSMDEGGLDGKVRGSTATSMSVLDQSRRCKGQRDQERRHSARVQRARQRALRGPRIRADHAGPLSPSTMARGPTSSSPANSTARRRHKHDLPAGAHVQARRRPGDDFVPSRGGARQHGADGQWRNEYPRLGIAIMTARPA
jgi:hypothetical protein